MNKSIFDLLPLTWQFFSTVATVLAVATAIFLPAFRDRRRLKVASMIEASQVTRHRTIFRITAFATNLGRNRITVTSWGICYRRRYVRDRGIALSIFIGDAALPLPKVLEYSDSLKVEGEIDPEDKNALGHIFFSDSTGKDWKAHRRIRRAFRKDVQSLPDLAPEPRPMGRSNSLREMAKGAKPN
ncbi:MAG: hypothetical protein ABSG85_02705 [Spirochaetia bacterium]|jgi:hypothetical protein